MTVRVESGDEGGKLSRFHRILGTLIHGRACCESNPQRERGRTLQEMLS